MEESFPQIANRKVGIIIPAYNPPSNFMEICKGLAYFGFSLYIVNDGSSGFFSSIQGKVNITLITHACNLGQGAAIETGVRRAFIDDIQYFVTFDADGQHQPAAVDNLLQVLYKQEADIIFGSRFLKKEHTDLIPFWKKRILKLGIVVDRIFTGIRLTDSHNGFRAFNRKVASELHFKENRMAHATELLWLVKKKHWKYGECAVEIRYDVKSQHPARSIEIIIDLILRKLIS